MSNQLEIPENSAVLPEGLVFHYKAENSTKYVETRIILNYAFKRNNCIYLAGWSAKGEFVKYFNVDRIYEGVHRSTIREIQFVPVEYLRSVKNLRSIFFFVDQVDIINLLHTKRIEARKKSTNPKSFIARLLLFLRH